MEGNFPAGQQSVRLLRQTLAFLYASGFGLPSVSSPGFPEMGKSKARPSLESSFLSGLPLGFYSVSLDPLQVPNDEVGAADLADDITDTYRDVKHGLDCYDAGFTEEAVWEWKFGFEGHWGRHVASALFALHCYADKHDPPFIG